MGEATERILISNDWITIVLLIIIGLLIYNKTKHPVRFKGLQTLLYNNSYINNYSKSTPLILNTFNITFYFIFILIASLLLHVTINLKGLTANNNESFLIILLYVFSFVIIRSIIGLLFAFLFEKGNEQQYFTFTKLSYLGSFCLLILPLLIINFYINSVYFSQFLIIVAILLLLFYYFLQIKNNQKLVFSKMFYFILYLCALEISPFIVIYRLIIK